MKIGYVVMDDTNESFLKEHFDEDVSRKLASNNGIDMYFKTDVNRFKLNSYTILDFKLFKDNVQALQTIRSLEKIVNGEFIIFDSQLSEEDVNFFIKNDFYNILPKADMHILQDILDKKVNYEYNYGFSITDEQIEDDLCIFNQDISNISLSCIDENLTYDTFLFSLNLANYLDKLNARVYNIEYNTSHTNTLVDCNILMAHDDHFISSSKDSNIIYSIENIPYKATEEVQGFYIHNYGHFEDKITINSDINIIITNGNLSNIEKIKKSDILDEHCYVLVLNPLLETIDYINSLNIDNLFFIKSISSLNSTLNFKEFRKMFEDKLIQFL